MTTSNERLQRARLAKHWSMAVASRRAGVSVNTFNRWERGLQIPQLATLDQLLDAFGMSAEELGFGFVISPSARAESACSAQLESASVPEKAQAVIGMVAFSAQVELNDNGLGVVEVPEKAQASLFVEEGVSVASASHRLRSTRPAHVQPAASTRAEAEAEQMSRRQVIAALIGTPAAIFCSRQGDNLSLLRAEEILTLCASHIPLCWQLYFEGGRAEVEKVLLDYITQLTTLARYASAYQQRAASLLSQAYQLASLLAMQHQDYGVASTAAQQGLVYSELAGDANLQAGSLIRQALVAFFLKRPRSCLRAYQSALPLIPQVSPLLQGRVYVGLAEVCSRLTGESEAQHFLELGREISPSRSEDDPSYSFTHFSHTSTSTYEGLIYLNLQQHSQAEQSFERINRMISTGAVPNRLELLVHQTMLARDQGELEQTASLIQTALPIARALGSQLRADQLYEIYESILGKWGGEPSVKELGELFR